MYPKNKENNNQNEKKENEKKRIIVQLKNFFFQLFNLSRVFTKLKRRL